MDVQILSTQEYQKLCERTRLIKREKRRLQILLTQDNHIIKFVYKPRLSLPKKIIPETKRFVKNAQILKSHEILCPRVNAIYFYPTLKCNIIVYNYLSGHSLYDLACRNDTTQLTLLPPLISRLHSAGIIFSDLHLGNIIYTNNSLALIDIESIAHKRRPLTPQERLANLQFMFSLKRDVPIHQKFGLDEFLNRYFELSNLTNAMELQMRNNLYLKVSA